MATTTHTVSIKANPALHHGTVSAKRVSKSRQYGACLVATATQKLVDDRARRLALDTAALEGSKDRLVNLLAQYGMTFEAAKAKHDAESRAWFDLRFATSDRIRKERGLGYIPGIDNIVDKELAAQGVPNPYAAGTYYDIVTTEFDVRTLTSSVKNLSRPVAAGDQLVITWCRDAGLAAKALNGRDANYYRKDGFYTLAIRTDITVS